MEDRERRFRYKFQEHQNRFSIGRFVFALAFLGGLYFGLGAGIDKYEAYRKTGGMEVMPAEFYTLSYCGYSKAMKKNLQTAKIPFTEFVIDKDTAARKRLDKRQEAMKRDIFCCPVLIVNGRTFNYRSSMQDIRTELQAVTPR